MVERQVANGFTYRDEVVAGWTGPAQVQKGITEPAGFTELDLVYVDACRTCGAARLVRYDLGILWRTLKVMARRGVALLRATRELSTLK
jgi:hypothetical protein